MEKAIASPAKTREIIKRHGLTLKKSLGQNFLVDHDILDRIVEAAYIDASVAVVEIGPGIGALTEQLAQRAGRVTAIEIDHKLVPILTELFASYSQVDVIHADILAFDLMSYFEEHFATYSTISVVANLPYYITTPIIMKLLEERLPLSHIVVMIQKEVAERMTAEPGGKDYGSLSIAVQYYCTTEIVTIVPSTAFVPQPKVDSAVMRLTMRAEPPVVVDDEAHFFEVVRASFVQRRKTILNNLSKACYQDGDKEKLRALLEQCHINPTRRGETLSLDEYAQLSNALLKHG